MPAQAALKMRIKALSRSSTSAPGSPSARTAASGSPTQPSSKAAALTDPINAEFASVVKGWYDLAGATARLYIWNYVVDFGNPTQSYPNYYAIGMSHCRLTIAQAHGQSVFG